MEAVFIGGPSGVGKSTVARELQGLLTEPWLFFEVDRCQPLPPARPGFATLENEHAMVRANVAAVRSYVDAGFRVLAEMDVADAIGGSAVAKLLGARARRLVLTCSPDVAIARATNRAGPVGLDFVQAHSAFRDWTRAVVDRIVVTDDRSAGEVASSLVEWIEATGTNV